MVLCLLLCFCRNVCFFNMVLFPVCNYVGFLLRRTSTMFVSFPVYKADRS